MKDPVSVVVVVGSDAYQKTLAAKLSSFGMLRQVIDVVPHLEIRELDSDGKLGRAKTFPVFELLKRVAWKIWARLPLRVRPEPPSMLNVWLADRLISSRIEPCRIFHGCTSLCLASLQTAKKLGAITLVESATWHPREWNKMELEESSRFGLSSRDSRGELTESMLRRMEQEFENCDRIVVASSVALQSFAEYGFEKKTVMVPVGVDAEMFSPGVKIANIPRKTFRVCCVGRVEFAKGVAYLLEAWNRLRLPNAELVLVGEVKPQMKSLLEGCGERGVRLAGVLPRSEVAGCYQESDAFVLPSLHEGFGQVLLEAMASGLPVVATDRTGATDCIADGKEGLIVPARDADALANAILWCYEHPEERAAMGRAARARIESEFTLEHYNERVIALYRNLAATR